MMRVPVAAVHLQRRHEQPSMMPFRGDQEVSLLQQLYHLKPTTSQNSILFAHDDR